MRKILDDVRSGAYAQAGFDESTKGRPWFEQQRARERTHQIEDVGAKLRAMMPFLEPVAQEDLVTR